MMSISGDHILFFYRSNSIELEIILYLEGEYDLFFHHSYVS